MISRTLRHRGGCRLRGPRHGGSRAPDDRPLQRRGPSGSSEPSRGTSRSSPAPVRGARTRGSALPLISSTTRASHHLNPFHQPRITRPRPAVIPNRACKCSRPDDNRTTACGPYRTDLCIDYHDSQGSATCVARRLCCMEEGCRGGSTQHARPGTGETRVRSGKGPGNEGERGCDHRGEGRSSDPTEQHAPKYAGVDRLHPLDQPDTQHRANDGLRRGDGHPD